MGFFDNLLRKHVSQRNEDYKKASAQIKQWSGFIASILATDGLIQRSSYASESKEMYAFTSYAEKLSKRFVLFSSEESKAFKAVGFKILAF